MKTLSKTSILAAAAAFLSASCATAQPAMFLTADDMIEPSGICEASEKEVFYGESTTDEFGYGIAVCVLAGEDEADDRIAVIVSGEGGNLRTQCMASQCDGVIEYSRYTRFRFTELTLKWTTESGEHRMIEGFDAQGEEPTGSVTHYWPGDEDGEVLAPKYEELSLMQLDKSLPGN